MTELVQVIIAAMISFIPPGYSAYSQTPMGYCDDNCQSTRLCEDPSWKCTTPRFQRSIYNKKVSELQSTGLTSELAADMAKPLSYTRPETTEEALTRYTIIAEAVANVSRKMTYHMCKSSCVEDIECSEEESICSGNDPDCVEVKPCKAQVTACHQECARKAPWRWRRMELIYSLLTVMSEESGFRSDVHGGVGAAGRGDCDWKYPDGKKAKAWAKGTSPIPGSCRSVCLGQINLGAGARGLVGPEKWSADDLVGVDYTSTERCITQTIRELTRARLTCRKSQDWAGAMFSAYGTGWSCTNKKLIARSRKFWSRFSHPRTLDQKWVEIITKPEVIGALDTLRHNTDPIYWMIPVTPVVEEPMAAIIGEMWLASVN